MKYSDLMANWLFSMGYTHFFSVGGGNIMHLTESLSKRLICVPVVNEVAAGIAVEYFNQTSPNSKALALVTAGPGLTNIVTAIAGAFLESRELLVIGGQAKTADLARGALRQRGIQEIDGVSIVRPITVLAELIDKVLTADEFASRVRTGSNGRNGPVFLEIPLDIQATKVDLEFLGYEPQRQDINLLPQVAELDILKVAEQFNKASRPVILIGGGVSRETANGLAEKLAILSCPIMTTWNGADRISSKQANYMGRPNTWGQRSSNMILQQADFLLAVGSRLGLQQTGFNWQQFMPHGYIVQVELDQAELNKGHPKIDMPLCGDANHFLNQFCALELKAHTDWLSYAKEVRQNISLVESVNTPREGFVSPFDLADSLSRLGSSDDIIIPCSSGSAFTTMMQAFEQQSGQLVVTNKGLASMGYGLSGAIGAAIANPGKRVVLVEGDGGFAQNLQEIGTAAINQLNLKMFVLDDSGYASIRMTQKNYFGGQYVGCDRQTGLGLPNWDVLFSTWGLPVMRVKPGYENDPEFLELFKSQSTCAFVVTIDPEQTYFPKITSRVTETGAMESKPLHLMSPDLSADQTKLYLKYLD
jgi:acetolactate synthase-1/2/3 large subunit